jgi:phosphoserine phosphatase
MKQLNVIDFDNTLIPFDSFRFYIKKGLKKFNILFIFYTIARILRIIDNKTFKQKIMKINPFNEKEFNSFQIHMINSINQEILDKVKKYTSENTTNVLCSASPNFYISEIGEKINMLGHGSFFISEKEFFHMYGKKKVEFILQKYPREFYHYKYAISDSESDKALLSLFEEHELLK